MLTVGGLSARLLDLDVDRQRAGANGGNAPVPIAAARFGTASAARRREAVVDGLSDRLGWEAVVAWQIGVDMATMDCPIGSPIVFDGRVGHRVPTVIVVGEHSVRWGAGSTWQRAIDRALLTSSGAPTATDTSELEAMTAVLAESGLAIDVVDVDSPSVRAAGLFRCRVQLLVGVDDPPPGSSTPANPPLIA